MSILIKTTNGCTVGCTTHERQNEDPQVHVQIVRQDEARTAILTPLEAGRLGRALIEASEGISLFRVPGGSNPGPD